MDEVHETLMRMIRDEVDFEVTLDDGLEVEMYPEMITQVAVRAL